MQKLMCMVWLLLGALAACGEGPSTAELGQLSLPLQARGSRGGTLYRLTNAVFTVRRENGSEPALILQGNDQPTAPAIDVELDAARYSITLATGWRLDRVDPQNGATTPVQASLVSAAVQSFTIAQAQATTVTYGFQVDGGIVNTGDGRLSVAIAVNDSADASLADAALVDAGAPGTILALASASTPPGVRELPFDNTPVDLVSIPASDLVLARAADLSYRASVRLSSIDDAWRDVRCELYQANPYLLVAETRGASFIRRHRVQFNGARDNVPPGSYGVTARCRTSNRDVIVDGVDVTITATIPE